jgi:hypothetical protein
MNVLGGRDGRILDFTTIGVEAGEAVTAAQRRCSVPIAHLTMTKRLGRSSSNVSPREASSEGRSV